MPVVEGQTSWSGPRFAQTNVQLYQQLRELGWDGSELAAVARCYELAMVVVAGQYRSNGRPFVSHLSGTASVVAASGGGAVLVKTALLHSVYFESEWGDGRRGATEKRRGITREVAGADAERLIYLYPSLIWTNGSIAGYCESSRKLTADDRALIQVRLANEIDERSDLGLLHSERRLRDLPPMVELSELLGWPLLGAELDRIRTEEDAANVEHGLRRPHSAPHLQAPLSHRPKLSVRVNALRRDLRSRGGRALRRVGLRGSS